MTPQITSNLGAMQALNQLSNTSTNAAARLASGRSQIQAMQSRASSAGGSPPTVTEFSAQARLAFMTMEASASSPGSRAAVMDADMSAESARLSSLQTQQQLGVQALSLANQSSQALMSLFRG